MAARKTQPPKIGSGTVSAVKAVIPEVPCYRIAVTGHRPGKLFGYNINSDQYTPVRKFFRKVIATVRINHPVIEAISGMALGADTIWAQEAIAQGIKLHSYVPFVGQHRIWYPESVAVYKELLKKAGQITVVTQGEVPQTQVAKAMNTRNHAMVDACDLLVAIWDGSSGGTGNCVQYARGKGVKILVYHPFTGEMSKINFK